MSFLDSVGKAVGGVVAPLASSVLGYAGAQQTNDAQVDLYKNRYQMTMRDMERAGLNPILAANPSGMAGSIPQLQNPLGAAVGGYWSAKQSQTGAGLAEAQTSATAAQEDRTRAETVKIAEEIQKLGEETRTLAVAREKMAEEISSLAVGRDLTRAQTDMVVDQMGKLLAEKANLLAQARLAEARGEIERADLVYRKALADFYTENPNAAWMKEMLPLGSEAADFISSIVGKVLSRKGLPKRK